MGYSHLPASARAVGGLRQRRSVSSATSDGPCTAPRSRGARTPQALSWRTPAASPCRLHRRWRAAHPRAVVARAVEVGAQAEFEVGLAFARARPSIDGTRRRRLPSLQRLGLHQQRAGAGLDASNQPADDPAGGGAIIGQHPCRSMRPGPPARVPRSARARVEVGSRQESRRLR